MEKTQQYTVRFECPFLMDVRVYATDEDAAVDKAIDLRPTVIPGLPGWVDNAFVDVMVGDAEPYSAVDATGEEVWKQPTALDELNAGRALIAKIRAACQRSLERDEHTQAGHTPAYILDIINGTD